MSSSSENVDMDPTLPPQEVHDLPPDPLLQPGSFIDPEEAATVTTSTNKKKRTKKQHTPKRRKTAADKDASGVGDDSGSADNKKNKRTKILNSINNECDAYEVDDADVGDDAGVTEGKKKRRIKILNTPNKESGAGADDEVVVERPSWLPEGWKMESKVRTSGATAGTIDRELDLGFHRRPIYTAEREKVRDNMDAEPMLIDGNSSSEEYYFEPNSNTRFRSKKEVEFYLQTGTKKKKSDHPADVNPSEVPASSSKKKSGSKTKTKIQGAAADVEPSESPVASKKEKSTSRTKKNKHDEAGDVQPSESPAGSKKKSKKGSSTGLPQEKFDFDDVPEMVTWKLTDASFMPFIDGEMVPESVKAEWDAAADSLCSEGQK